VIRPHPAAIALGLVLATASPAGAATLLVGPGHRYATPCAAMAAAAPGDTVRIDAAGSGGYDGDVCASAVPRLTIEGFNGRPRIDAAGRSSGGKGIWVLSGPGTVVRNVELSGAAVPDRNGAAIRLEGEGDLTLVGSFLHGNQDGILVTASATQTDVRVRRTVFAGNGAGDGLSHNIYVARARSFSMRFSASRRASVGHLVKTRAAVNDISYNRLIGGGGTGSYEIDVPDGGRTRVVGNVLHQGPRTENSAMLAYGMESASNPRSRLTVARNAFLSDRPGPATAVLVGDAVRRPARVTRNLLAGDLRLTGQPSARTERNCRAPLDEARRLLSAAPSRALSPCSRGGTG
jgi:hypothetical protein